MSHQPCLATLISALHHLHPCHARHRTPCCVPSGPNLAPALDACCSRSPVQRNSVLVLLGAAALDERAMGPGGTQLVIDSLFPGVADEIDDVRVGLVRARSTTLRDARRLPLGGEPTDHGQARDLLLDPAYEWTEGRKGRGDDEERSLDGVSHGQIDEGV